MSGLAATMHRVAIPATSLQRLRLALVGYGVILALFAVFYWSASLPPNQLRLQGSRVELLQNSISVLEQGGPPLLGSSVPYKQGLKNPSTLFAVNWGDDEGVYLYVPVAAHLLGENSPTVVGKWFSIAGLALIPLLYPLIVFLLFDSLAAAIIVPAVATIGLKEFVGTDIYWVTAWVILLGLPLVYLAARRSADRRRDIALLAAAALAASFANSMRAHAGTGVALSALVVALAKPPGWRRRAVAAGVVVAAYVAITPVMFTGIRAYRDHVSHLPAPVLPTAHPLWHPTYLGLGYLPNKWGIKWDDLVGFHAAQRVDPHVTYLSPHYEHILRHLYLSALKDDPGWVAHLYAVKLAVLFRGGWDRFWPALLVLPALLLARGRTPRVLRRWVLLLLPALVLAMVPPLLTLPLGYPLGFYGAIGLLSLLVLAIVVRAAAPHVRRLTSIPYRRLLEEQPLHQTAAELRTWAGAVLPRRRPTIADAMRAAPLAAAVLATVGVASAASAVVASERNAFEYYPNETAAASVPAGSRVVRMWDGQTLPTWLVLDKAAVAPSAAGLTVTTGTQPNVGDLASPEIALGAGTYAVHAAAAVPSGGLVLQVTDLASGTLLATGYYWDGQKGLDHPGMLVPFAVASPTRVRVVLINWRSAAGSSIWKLRNVQIVRVPAP